MDPQPTLILPFVFRTRQRPKRPTRRYSQPSIRYSTNHVLRGDVGMERSGQRCELWVRVRWELRSYQGYGEPQRHVLLRADHELE